jgi:SARP family transcriptional regulator, regulator of embCAB operon
LNERILRQDQLDVKKSATTTAVGTITVLDQRTMVSGQKGVAYLHGASGRSYPLQSAATRIGRLSDNDIVLDSANVSRHHEVIVDTGTNYIINDLRSSNGVHVQHQRIRAAATLNDGDHIRICDHEFTFQINAGPGQSG